jgi:hypothetical protein
VARRSKSPFPLIWVAGNRVFFVFGARYGGAGSSDSVVIIAVEGAE